MRKLVPVFTLSLSFAVLASLVTPRSSLAADETSVAREHAQKGKAFMDLGKYTEAATEYEASYAAKQDPALLLNLAQAYRLAGNTDKALFFYRKYLQHVPKSPYRADIEEKIAALEKQSKTEGKTEDKTGGTAPGSLTEAPPPGPPGAPAPGPGFAPPPGAAAPPTAMPGAPAPGAYGGPANAPGTQPNPGIAPGGMPPPEVTAPAPAPAADHGQKLKLAGLVTGGVGVLAFVVAAVFGAQAKDAAKKIEQGAAAGGIYSQELQDQDSRGRSAQTRATASVVIGVAALAGGGVLYYLGARHTATEGQPAPGSVAILPAASIDELGAAVRVTF
jgi:tetratricopeptide (TPR) repeat protein